jgi:hypothetical protein
VLVVAGLRVGVAVNGLHLPLGILECHLFVLRPFRIHLLLALPLAGRCAFLAWLLLFLTELFRGLLDLPALTHVVARRLMYGASSATIVAVGHLTGVLVASWVSAPTCLYSYSCGGSSQQLVVVVGLLLLLAFVVASALSSSPCIGLAILACLWGR